MSAPFLTLVEGATLLGRYRHVELALAKIAGRGAASGASRTAPYLSAACGAHAWRAALFEARLPVSAGLPEAAELTTAGSAELAETLAALGELDDDVLLVALVRRVYPAMLATWERHRTIASPIADPPLLLCLRRAAADLAAVREDGEAVLARLGGLEVPVSVSGLLDESGPFGRLSADGSLEIDA